MDLSKLFENGGDGMSNCNQLQMPILEALIHHIQQNPVPMHVPGHKMGRGFPSELGAWLEAALKLDVTELPGLDDLHNPSGPIQLAQELAAQAFSADHTFFLVNGSTSGIYAMIFSACKPGERMIVARNFHKSVIQACTLGNVRPVFIDLPPDPFSQSAGACPLELVEQAIRQFPDAKAVLITSPTYQGIFSPISEIADVVHKAGMLLLVDEAHGAHLTFHPHLRKHAALLQGADLVVQSTHKMLGSMTQTAMLHAKGESVDLQRLRKYVSFFQSSSPSYVLLASIDAARSFMATQGQQKIQAGLERLLFLQKQSNQWRYINMVPMREDRDPFKVVLRFTRGSTEQAEHWLRTHHQLYFEMATPSHLLAVAGYADTQKMMERFVHALTAYDHWLDTNEGIAASSLINTSIDPSNITAFESSGMLLEHHSFINEPVVSLQEIEQHGLEWVDIDQSIGRIAYHSVAPYPPGIPVICPGERIEQQMIDQIKACLRQHGNVQGLGGINSGQIAVCTDL